MTNIWMFKFPIVVSRYTSRCNTYHQVSDRWWCWLPVGIHQQNEDYSRDCRLCPAFTFHNDCFRGDWRGKSRWQDQCVRAGFINRWCRSYFIDWKATTRLCHHWRSQLAVVDYSLESGGLQTTDEERRHRSCCERRPISIRRATVNQRLRSQTRIKKTRWTQHWAEEYTWSVCSIFFWWRHRFQFFHHLNNITIYHRELW